MQFSMLFLFCHGGVYGRTRSALLFRMPDYEMLVRSLYLTKPDKFGSIEMMYAVLRSLVVRVSCLN